MTDGTVEADAIILRRLTECIRNPVQDPTSLVTGHMHYEDGRTCPRCGINRPFKMEVDYDVYDDGVRIPTGTIITLL
jgi:hypothetical protein